MYTMQTQTQTLKSHTGGINSSVPVAPVRSRSIASDMTSHSPKSDISTRGLFKANQLLVTSMVSHMWSIQPTFHFDARLHIVAVSLEALDLCG